MEKLKDILTEKELDEKIKQKFNRLNININHTLHKIEIYNFLNYKYTQNFKIENMKEAMTGLNFGEFNERANARKKTSKWNRGIYIENVLMPSFVKMFWIFIIYYEKIPSPIMFLNFYFRNCCIKTGKETFDFQPWCDYKKPERKIVNLPEKTTLYNIDLLVRFNNFYCALIRELTLGERLPTIYEKIKEQKLIPDYYDIQVIHDLETDIFKDGDLIIKVKNLKTSKIKKIYLVLFDKTKDSFEKRIQKVISIEKLGKVIDYDLKLGIPAYLSKFCINQIINTVNFEDIDLYKDSVAKNLLINILKSKYTGNWIMDNYFNMIDLKELINKRA